MILAAGLGTRLGALGETTPKALIEVGGRTLLERVVGRFVAAGATRVVVNVHHHAERIARFVAGHDLGVEVLLSREDERPLETGGGLWHARALFTAGETILVHNVDVLTGFRLEALRAAQERGASLATLVVQERDTARQLLFDEVGLCGREDRRTGERREVRPPRGAVRALAFSGIHCCAPRLFDLVTERGVFGIVDVYLRLAAAGHVIAPWVPDGGRWLELGNPERLAAAHALLERDPRALD
jgi:N-acetyl-alpha-D-muramate 1-phosphate uridylyltransferase